MEHLRGKDLDTKVAAYLRVCKKPVDINVVIAHFAASGVSAFEVKEAVWKLLDASTLEFTKDLDLVVA